MISNPAKFGSADPKLTSSVGERRQITALFYDIVDSTLLLNTLDPEDFGEAQRAIHTAVASVVRRYDGTLDQIVGDGGCAFFGYPVASEDAAESAVSAALEIVKRCKALQAQGEGPSLGSVRVGVATGTVVVNDLVRNDLPGGHEVIGLSVNLAARLQSYAAPDTVLVSETTYRLTQSAFEYRFGDTIEVKGFSAPQPVWQPVEKRLADSRFETKRRSDTPLVGRAQESDICLRCWTDAKEGRGRILFLTGEAGIGKSRLVSEISQNIDGARFNRRLFQCEPRGNRRPFHPVVDRFLRSVRQFSGSEDLTQGAARAYLRRLAPDVGEEGLDVLSLLAEGDPGDTGLLEVHGQDFGRAAVGAMIDVLTAWTKHKPQFIVLEDFHWADALTQSLVRELADRIGNIPALLIVTSRDPVDPALADHSAVSWQDLSRLSPNSVVQILKDIWKPLPVPRGLPHFIEQRSEGVPLFVEEVSHLLKDRLGQAPSTRKDWSAVLQEGGVSTLKDLLLARVARLGDARRVAQIASVIGREFSRQHIRAIAGGISTDTIDRHLAALNAGNIIHSIDGGGGPSFRFRHVLLQEAAYDSLLKSEQRELHRRVVAATNKAAFPRPPDDVMAWHCERAGQFIEAAQYALGAAEGCAVRSAVQEAHNLLASADTCLSRLPASTRKGDVALRLLAIRGPIEMALYGSGSREARQTYEDAVAICRGKGLTDREQWFPLYWGWWVTSPNAEAVDRSRVIVSDLENTADSEIKLQALHCSWATHFHAGNHQECLHCIELGLLLYDPERAVVSRTKYGGHDAKVCALAERGQSLWFRGDREAAVESVEAALRWAEEIEHLGSICHALDVALLFHHFEQNLPGVLRHAKRMRELADRHNLPNCEAKSDIFSGWARALQGEVKEGRDIFERGLTHQLAIGTEEDLPLYLDMRAATLEREGDDQRALQAVEEALNHARRTSNVFWLPELYRRRAILGQRCSWAAERVRDDLLHALQLAQEQGAELIAQRVRGELLRIDPGAQL
ncbi:ATP-binding protein [Microvirga puerhi]|uniref:AAA family ATPase n=1 Tax=Microvirga puerhi TaxID=2876078 RepID=A0ABS7VMM0_9HYPH|nr:adenylate/guanylate cyclase domain-containing protein [Microvirga puerhi]MBZ6076789.1 AAA family ATPase [Microvirga puerhi]